jgi:hypothetical protein
MAATFCPKPIVSSALKIAPGCVLINVSNSRGGVTHAREAVTESTATGRGRRIEYQAVKRIDNEVVVKQIVAAVKDVDHCLRINCARLPFGHFVPVDGLLAINACVASIAARVAELNAVAEKAGSKHRGYVNVVNTYLDLESPATEFECRRTVGGLLEEIHQALRAGDVVDAVDRDGCVTRRHQLRPILQRAQHIDTLFQSPVSIAVKAAIQRAKVAKTELIRAIGSGADPAAAGLAVDLTEVEQALAWFQ